MMVEEPMLVDWSQNGIVEGWGWENEGRSANTKMCRMWGRLGLIEKKIGFIHVNGRNVIRFNAQLTIMVIYKFKLNFINSAW